MVAEARKDCEKAAPAYPAHDEVPPPAGHCDALSAYYGIGEPVDDAKARACAYASKDYAVLSMLYANGRGVPRDIAVARKAVCDERDAAPAEISGRLQHLARIEAGEEAAGGYDFCDDATSGLTTGWCSCQRSAFTGQTRIGIYRPPEPVGGASQDRHISASP
jgi:hypothetical protein